ncbi:helix-turn-helix domain-containing protein [Streptomyces sp. NPDC007083]|uniref:helix-turn-helix domain-containing protein n=1 Tax=Streptomyces sp. NPDC007083 TaxID=3156913 RepID=UPI0033F5087B
MLTVQELADTDPTILAFVGHPPAHAAMHVVEHVLLCDDRWRPDSQQLDVPVAGALALAPESAYWLHNPHEAGRRLRALERRGAVGLVLSAPGTGCALSPTTEAGHLPRLPLLTSPLPAAELQALVLRRQVDALRSHAHRQARLLEMLPRLGDGGHVQPLWEWLERQTGARIVTLPGPSDARTQHLAAAGHARILRQLHAGEVHSAALEADGRHILIHPLGAHPPHQLLTALRPSPWPRPEAALLAHAAGLLSAHAPALVQARQQRAARAETAYRHAAWPHLLRGELTQARHALAPVLPRLWETGAVQVGVLECAPDESSAAVAAEADQALEWRALVVLSPEHDRHLIVCHPHDPDAPSAIERLRPLLDASMQRTLGASRPTPWGHCADAYHDALQTLADARATPERVAVHRRPPSVVSALPAEHREAWAAEVLRPAREAIGEAEFGRIAATVRLTITYGAKRAARLLAPGGDGPHRNTLGRQLARLASQVGVEQHDVCGLAVLRLALEMAEALPSAPDPAAVPTLHHLLRSPTAEAWAEAVLRPLNQEQRDLLATWFRYGTNTQATAGALGIHRNTLATRLPLLKSTAAGGRATSEIPYDALLALVITGTLPVTVLPDPAVGARSEGEETYVVGEACAGLTQPRGGEAEHTAGRRILPAA